MMRPTARLAIVRDEATLYRLVASSEIAGVVLLILDRREGDRRRDSAEGSVERRITDRRRVDVVDVVRRDGFAIVDAASGVASADDALA